MEEVTKQRTSNGKLLGGITGKGFMPGQSGNPAGRKKGLSITAALQDYYRAHPDEFSGLLEKIRNDEGMRRIIWNYFDGMPKQSVETELKGDFLIQLGNEGLFIQSARNTAESDEVPQEIQGDSMRPALGENNTSGNTVDPGVLRE